MPVKGVEWTEESKQFLRDNYKTMSAAEIASKLGGVYSRNAVIGKARRLGLSADTREIPARRGKPPELTTTKKKFHPRGRFNNREKEDAPVAKAVRLLDIPVTIMDLEAWHCREIVEETPVVKYCGKQKIDSSSYCPDHHRKNHAFVPTSRLEKYYGI